MPLPHKNKLNVSFFKCQFSQPQYPNQKVKNGIKISPIAPHKGSKIDDKLNKKATLKLLNLGIINTAKKEK